MKNGSRRKREQTKGSVEELRSEFDRCKAEMQDLGERMDTVEQEKSNLRCVNQMLIQKLKKAEESTNPFQVFLLRRELEKEREKSKFAAEKLVTKRLKSKALKERFAKSIGRNIVQEKDDTILQMEISEVYIFEVTEMQLKEDNRLLKSNIEHLIKNEGSLRREVEKLKKQNRELLAEKGAKTFAHHMIIESLQERLKEEENSTEKELEKWKFQLKSANEHIEYCKKQTHDIENRALSAEAKIKEQANVIELQEEKLSEAEEMGRILEEAKYRLENEVEVMSSKIIEKDNLLRSLDEQLKDISLKIVEFSKDLQSWQSEAEHLKERCRLKEVKISKIDKEKQALEMELSKLNEARIDETKAFMEKISLMQVDITSSHEEKEDICKKITIIENDNKILTKWMESFIEEGKRDKSQKVGLEREIVSLKEKNDELNETIGELKQMLRKLKKPWWKKLVSCS